MNAFLLALVLLAPHPIAHALGSTVEIHGDIEQASTADVQDFDNRIYCVGTLISYARGTALIATARHCVAPSVEGTLASALVTTPTPRYVTFFDGAIGKIKRIRVSAQDDIGYITVAVPRKESPAVVLADIPERGKAVFVVGDPFGQHWSYTQGYSMRGSSPPLADVIAQMPPVARSFSISCASCGPGDSGGGVYSPQGALLGILVAGGAAEKVSLIEPSWLILRDLHHAVPVSSLLTPEGG